MTDRAYFKSAGLAKIGKGFLLVLGFFLGINLLLAPITLSAQSSELKTEVQSRTEKDRMVLLLRTKEHFQAAIATKKGLDLNDDFDVGAFEVIICGKLVKEFTKGGSMEAPFKEALQNQITVSLCGMSLDKFAIDKANVFEGLKFVPNGLIRTYELQKKGYLSIEL